MKKSKNKTFAQTKTFRVATYNVENYLDDTASRCCVKSAASKTKVRECIRALRPDVLALQEMGGVAALLELRAALQTEGLDFPYWEHVTGSDADVHVAILSRFPFSARRPHTDDSFELGGQQWHRHLACVFLNNHSHGNSQARCLCHYLQGCIGSARC